MSRNTEAIFAVALACWFAGCSFLKAPPAEVVHDSCAALRDSCDFYNHASSVKHTPEADRACAKVEAACASSGGTSSGGASSGAAGE